MKKMLVFLGLLAAVNAKAQLVEWIYGSPTTSVQEMGSGVALRMTGTGHFLAGNSNTNRTNLILTRGDLTGQTTVLPSFNKTYEVVPLAGSPVFIQSSKVEELAGTYAVAGDYRTVNGQEGVYYVNVNGGGTPALATVYSLTNTSLRLGSIYVENGTNTVYLTGSILYSSGGGTASDIFIMKVASNGGITWANRYSITASGVPQDETAYDLSLTSTGNSLAVVGAVSSFGSAVTDGFFLAVNPTTGAVTGTVQRWGTANSTDDFRSIIPTVGGDFLVCGKTNATTSGDFDMWALLLNTAGSGAAWNRIYQYQGTTNPHNDGLDAVQDPNNNNDFYLTGTVDAGVLGNSDLYVIHTDNGGRVVTQGQYSYGGSAHDMGASIDLISSSSSAFGEIYMFGTSYSFATVTPNQLFYVKAQLNGILSNTCTFDIRDGRMNTGPGFIGTNDFNVLGAISQTQAVCLEEADGEQYLICSVPTSPKQQQTDLETQGSAMDQQTLLISPNPVDPGTSNIQLNVNAPVGTINVIVADYMGRQYINQRFDIRDGGEQTLSVELGKANLAPGLYLLKVDGLHKPATQVLVVK